MIDANDDLKAMTVNQLRSWAKAWLREMDVGSRETHKRYREDLLLPVLDEYKTRPEAQEYGALYVFLRDIGVKPGTVRQWRKRRTSPRPSNGRERHGNGHGGSSGNGRRNGGGRDDRHALRMLSMSIESTLEALTAGRIELSALADGNALSKDNVAKFLGAVDKEGHATPMFRQAYALANTRAAPLADGNALSRTQHTTKEETKEV